MAKTKSKPADLTPGPPDLDDEGAVRDGEETGNGNGSSIADRAEEELPIPESKPLGEKGGQIPLPGTPAQKRKPVEIVVQLSAHHMPGAGQLAVDEEHLLITRAEYVEGIPRAKRDGERQIIGWKYIQKLRSTWTETLADFLDRNGLKIVKKDEEGASVDPRSLVNIEKNLQERQEALGTD
jgi:hypothetical protein